MTRLMLLLGDQKSLRAEVVVVFEKVLLLLLLSASYRDRGASRETIMLLLVWTGSLQFLSGWMSHHIGGLVLVSDRHDSHRHTCLLPIRKLSISLCIFIISL